MARRKIISIKLKELPDADRKYIEKRILQLPQFSDIDRDTLIISGYPVMQHRFNVAAAYNKLLKYMNNMRSYDEKCVSVTGLAKILGISRLTFTRWIESGEFEFKTDFPRYGRATTRKYYLLDSVRDELKKYLNETK